MRFGTGVSLFLCVFLFFGVVGAAAQTTYTVNVFQDGATETVEPGDGLGPGLASGGNYDLRGAILTALSANAGGSATIKFSCSAPPCTITLAAQLPPIFETSSGSAINLTIDGGTQGKVVIDGANAYRAFWVDGYASLMLKNLVIQNATATGGPGGFGAGGGGGGAGFGAGLAAPGAMAVRAAAARA